MSRILPTAFCNMDAYRELSDAFFESVYGDLYRKRMETLDYGALYQSHMHGTGHIERVILLGALLAMLENRTAEDTALLLDACAYHDTGRIDDTKDDLHGARSAENAARLTGRTGDDLAILRAMMTAHSVSGYRRDGIIEKAGVADVKRAHRLTNLLKDADGLDRVRLGDLDVNYLRTDAARELVSFAYDLFRAYREAER